VSFLNLKKDCDRVPYFVFNSDRFNEILLTDKRIGIILGPGPGSPDLHFSYYRKIGLLKII